MKTVILNPDIIALYNVQHRTILDAVARRDVAGAVAAITRHLETARQHLIGAETSE
jgi:DNA-binding GntR family transcriptional regulator